MWVAIAILIQALSGPEALVVRDAVYASEDACKAAIARNVPAKLDAKHKTEVEQGYRRYVCVRINGAEDLAKAK